MNLALAAAGAGFAAVHVVVNPHCVARRAWSLCIMQEFTFQAQFPSPVRFGAIHVYTF
jgi:hypothetical protein